MVQAILIEMPNKSICIDQPPLASEKRVTSKNRQSLAWIIAAL